MSLRSVQSRRGAKESVRRMRAVLGVIDDDLAELAEYLAAPIPTTALSDEDWKTAQAARAAVEQDLRRLEAEAAVAAVQASDWRAKGELAAQRGDTQLAEQARVRAAEADGVYRSSVEEMRSTRVFLQEWSVRVTRASDRARP